MALPSLGVGFPFISGLAPEIYGSGLVDFVELTPETLCIEQPGGTSLRLLPGLLDTAREVCGDLPMVVHGVELSIGSAHGMNEAYLGMLAELQRRWPFVWHSEHLGFQTLAGAEGQAIEIGVPLPLPPTQEAAALVSARARAIGRRFGVPFLLENPAHYLPQLPTDPSVGDEFGLMAAILEQGNCGQLLDLHNLYCNAVNFGFDPFGALDRIATDRVVEIHVAGGHELDGFRMDSHNGATPEAVWDLLAEALRRCPNVKGLVFEVLDIHAPSMGVAKIERELARAQDHWRRAEPRQAA